VIAARSGAIFLVLCACGARDDDSTGVPPDTGPRVVSQVREGTLTPAEGSLTGQETWSLQGDVCRVSYDLRGVAPRADCDICDWAWDLVVEDVNVEVDDACDALPGMATLEGEARAYGYAAAYMGHFPVLAVQFEDGWGAAGEAHLDEATGILAYAWVMDDVTLDGGE